ncbi:hypothetical protein M758_2G000100 [Ceratodon purpureus]|nr:hypothetical protein M758_2G000100 [Ceratodon purpureus]
MELRLHDKRNSSGGRNRIVCAKERANNERARQGGRKREREREREREGLSLCFNLDMVATDSLLLVCYIGVCWRATVVAREKYRRKPMLAEYENTICLCCK